MSRIPSIHPLRRAAPHIVVTIDNQLLSPGGRETACSIRRVCVLCSGDCSGHHGATASFPEQFWGVIGHPLGNEPIQTS